VRARLTVGELAHQQADKPYNTGAISTTNCVKDVFPVFFPKPCAKAKHRNLQVTLEKVE